MSDNELFARPRDRSWLLGQLRDETVGGFLLLGAAVVAILWANSPVSDTYFGFVDTRIGPAMLHLDLTIGDWTADALLAVFFFVVGLELKHELVLGSLSNPREAVVPAAAAVAVAAVDVAAGRGTVLGRRHDLEEVVAGRADDVGQPPLGDEIGRAHV